MPRTTRARRTAALVATLGLSVSALAACGGDDASSEDGPVLRVGVQKDGIRAVLDAAGLLDDLDYEIEWAEFTSGPPIVEAASADQIDVAWVGSAPPIIGAASSANFKVVAAVQERDSHENSILVTGDSDIKDVADLKGKRVAVGRGTSAHGLLARALDRVGLTFDDIDANYLAPADGFAAFTSGAVDAWVVWDPFVTQAVQEEGAVAITGGRPDEFGTQFEIASTEALEDPETRELVADFVDRLSQGLAWAVENPEEWGEAWATESGLPASTTTVVAAQKASDVIPVSDEIIAQTQELADLFHELGELPEKIDFASIVEPGLID
ncbi:ABC transporter substrate-binding protein [Nocardioides ochotonae]|uniref:ABC transporter substrate-binding protein n=1 Tax=Nocardioides ochotonae TaxID=2685869 RepID=UPI00140CE09C|nr:ABC transporter substrate-binding protein [Nocardioides ochotonae]